MQGGILGSPMCSASTAEYCEENRGISVGGVSIASLAFVDDLIDVNDTCEDTVKSHSNAIKFSDKKKLNFSTSKCASMIINKRVTDKYPELFIKKEQVQIVQLLKYLGDIFNANGNNDDLINDRYARGTKAMISIYAFMREICLGIYTITLYI